MDDDNELELSLGLSCGGSSAKLKTKSGSSADIKADDGDRGSKLVDDFKNFLHGGTQKQDSGNGSQRSDPLKPEESFFNNLSKAAIDVDGPTNLDKGVWVRNNNRSATVEDEKTRTLFDEISHQKKRDREADLYDKTRTSHISINTDDGSTADNEDFADSEVEGSTSRLISHPGRDSSEVQKEFYGVTDSSVGDLQGQKRYKVFSEKELKFGNMSYGSTFPAQSVNMVNLPYSLSMKESNSAGGPTTSGYPLPGMMQVMATATSERPGAQPVGPGNLPLMFGYSPVQLPMLEKDNSWGSASLPQQLHPSFAGRGPPNSVIPNKPSEAPPQYDGRALERAKVDGKQHATQEGFSSQINDGANGSGIIFRARESSDQPKAEVSPSEYPAIRPGVASDLKFGGCGSYPNLPWVSTTGPGPNGRTISGVTYRFSDTQIRIVCACHGSHMSPEEFVRHASEEQTNQETGNGLASHPSNNPAASAQS